MVREKRLNVQTNGTADRKYNVTGSGEHYYASNFHLGEAEFSKGKFEDALKKASRKTSAPAKGKKQT